jgi:nucleoporin p58/p45
MLYTTDMKPAGYNTKWEELHAESQKALLQIE